MAHPATRVMASSLVSQAALVVSGPLAVRLLGVEGRGEAAFVFATVLLVSQVGPWGVPQAWSFFIARGDVSARTLLAQHLAIYLVRAAVLGVIGAAAMAAVAIQDDQLTHPWREGVLAAAAIVVVMSALVVLFCLQGEQMYDQLAVVQAIPGLSYAAAMTVLTIVGTASVELVLAMNFAGWVAVVLVGARALRRVPDRADRLVPTRREIASYGRRAIVSAAAPIDNLGIDQLAVALLLSHEALGLYVIGLAFESAPVLALVALASVCTPSVAAIADPDERRRYCRRWLAVAAGVGIAATVAGEVAISLLLVPAFGPEAEPAIPVARILVVAGLFLGMRRVAAGMLQGCGQPSRATLAEIAGFVSMMIPMSQADTVTDACIALMIGGLVALTISVTLLLRPSSRASAASSSPSAPT